MSNIFKKLFEKEIVQENDLAYIPKNYSELDIQIAACALFIEMANADGTFEKSEMEKIIGFLQQSFQLNNEKLNELIQLSQEQVKESISIFDFTQIINEHFNYIDKYELLKDLWRIIYSDKILNGYEDKLIKNIGSALKFNHKEIIETKLLIRKELHIE